MGKIVVVDDIRLSADTRALHCGNTDEAITLFAKLLENGVELDELWLDYDMSHNRGIGWPTTMPLAEWLVENQQSRTPLVVRNIYVHSRHTKARDLVTLLEPHFNVSFGELPDPMWCEMPEEEENE